MFPIFLNAFWLPIKHAKQVLTIFWPVIVALGITIIIIVTLSAYTTEWTKAALHFKIASLWSIYFYVSFLMISGVIKWHRVIILKEQAMCIHLVPTLREIRYLARGMLLFLACGVAVFLSSLRIGPLFGKSLTNTLEPLLVLLIVLFLFTLILRSFVLYFPAMAVGSDENVSRKQLENIADNLPWTISVFVVLAFFMIASLISFIKLSVIVLRPDSFPEYINAFQMISFSFAFSIIFVFYGLLTFTTLLSLYYLKHIHKAQKNQAQ